MDLVVKLAEHKNLLIYIARKAAAALRRHQGFEVMTGLVFVTPRRNDPIQDMREAVSKLLRKALVMLNQDGLELRKASLAQVVRIHRSFVHLGPQAGIPIRRPFPFRTVFKCYKFINKSFCHILVVNKRLFNLVCVFQRTEIALK
jgi:hypothetical protein